MKTRVWYGEQILNQLHNGLRNRDEKISIREVYAQMDNVLNNAARMGFLENWKMGTGQLDQQFITRFEWLTLTDPANYGNSYVAMPANYVNLPRQQGINEVYFENDPTKVTKKYFEPVIVISQKDSITYRGNMAGQMQGRLSCWQQGVNLVFSQPNVNSVYGRIGMALVVHDATTFADTDWYPVPADFEGPLVQQCVDYFMARRARASDLVRDDNDNAA